MGSGETSREETSVRVIFFDDMRGSTALKELLAERSDEEAFQDLRREHDRLVSEIIGRDGEGEVVKSTGDGVLAVFEKPSVAVERAIEIQERLHEHAHIRARIGLDMGEVKAEYVSGRIVDVFGRHVDWAARAMALAADGHICVTRPVYTDGVSWITKRRIAWKAHGTYHLKRGDPPLDLYEPYNANVRRPMRRLRGEKIAGARSGTRSSPEIPAAALLRERSSQ
jgi:adenylate cyclase